MTALCLGLVLAVVHPLEPFLAAPLERVVLEGEPHLTDEEFGELVANRVGDVPSATQIQTTLKRLYALGIFSDIQVDAFVENEKTVLVYKVSPRKRLESVEIVGTQSVRKEDLKRALSLRIGDEVDRHARSALQERATAFLQDKGFRQATVAVRQTALTPTQVLYHIVVNEGEPTRVRSIRIEGAHRVTEQILREEIKTEPNDIADVTAIVSDQENLLRTFKSKGFWRCVVEEPEIIIDDQHADVVFKIDAGPRIAIMFAGNTLFTGDELRGLIEEADFSASDDDLLAFRSAIESAYQRSGYADASVTLTGFTDTPAQTTRYLYRISEGEPLFVKHLAFPGATFFSEEILRAQILGMLAKNLFDDRFVQKLPHGVPPHRIVERIKARSKVAPEERWVPYVYEDAINEVLTIYKGRGFLDARVGPAKLERGEGRVATVTIPIEEGAQTRVRSISFSDNTVFVASDLLLSVEQAPTPLSPGAEYSFQAAEDARITLVRKYRDSGYIYARLFVDTQISNDSHWADVRFRIEEGVQVHVGKVLVRGNDYTREGLIRSRITLAPGDIYTLDQAIEDQRSIAELGVFSSTRVKLIDEDKQEAEKDLVAEVRERDRQRFEIAPGISTAEGPRIRVSYSHINFLGTATSLTTSARFNRQIFFKLYGSDFEDIMSERYAQYNSFGDQLVKGIERRLQLGVRSPRIKSLPGDPSFRLDFVNERENTVPFSLDRHASAIFGADFHINRRITLSIDPQVSFTDLECTDELDCTERVLQQTRTRIVQGERLTFKIGPSITLDFRDNPFNPRKGIFLSAKTIYAFGGAEPSFTPFSFWRFEANLSGYIPFGRLVLATSLRGGNIQVAKNTVPADERFYLGGQGDLRGFVEQTLIPDDACVQTTSGQVFQGDRLLSSTNGCADLIEAQVDDDGNELPPVTRGGLSYVLLKTELRIPVTSTWGFALFADIGNLWIGTPNFRNLRIGTGAGLRYMTPVGPIVLDFGVNPNPREAYSEPTYQIRFAIGVF